MGDVVQFDQVLDQRNGHSLREYASLSMMFEEVEECS
jgi:hypothetical protein